MWLLVQYIDSEFPDYDIVNKTRLLKIKYGSKNIKLIRAESDQSVHRAVVIQESEHEFRLKIVKDMLLKEHREKCAAKNEWRKRNKGITVTKRSSRVIYSSSDSDTESDGGGRVTSENRHDIQNGIANSMSCSSINEPPSSSEDSIPFSGSPKVEYAASTSTPYPAIDSNTTYSHPECTDKEVQAGPDRITRKLEKIVSVGVPVQQEMFKALKMFEEFRMKFPEELNESALNTSKKGREFSPEIRRSRRRIREPNLVENISLNSSINFDRKFQKRIIMETAESVRQNILKVLAMYNELDLYPEAYMYKAKDEVETSNDERASDSIEDEESDIQ